MENALVLETNAVELVPTTNAVELQALRELSSLELSLVGGGQASISLI